MISLFESFVIALVILLVLGPNQLSQLSEQLGRWWLQYRQWSEQGQRFIDQQVKRAQLAMNETRAQQAEQTHSKSDKPQ